MEVEYGIGVTNRFAFLCDEPEDDDVGLTDKGLGKKTNVDRGSAKKPDSEGSLKEKKNVGNNAKGQNQTTPKIRKNNTKENTNPKSVAQALVENEKKRDVIDTNNINSRQTQKQFHGIRKEKEGFQPQKNFRGRGGAWEEKEIDKENKSKSKSGLAPKSNMENDVNERSGDESNEAEKDVKESVDSDGVVPKDKDESENVPEVPEQTFTLTEWKSMQAPREKPVFNIRRPGEGEDSSKLGKLILKKKEDFVDAGNEVEEFETEEVYYPQRAGKFKQIADVGFTTGYQKRRGGRFGRGRGGDGDKRESSSEDGGNVIAEKVRGRLGYGPRGGQHRPPPLPRIDDAADFPSLG